MSDLSSVGGVTTYLAHNQILGVASNIGGAAAVVWFVGRWAWTLARFCITALSRSFSAALRRATFPILMAGYEANKHPSLMIAFIVRAIILSSALSLLMFMQAFDGIEDPVLFQNLSQRITSIMFIVLGNLFLIQGIFAVWSVCHYATRFYHRDKSRRLSLKRRAIEQQQ